MNTKIKYFRRRALLTQAQLAEQTGIDQSAICRIERGERDFTVKQLMAIAGALKVNPATLLPSKAA